MKDINFNSNIILYHGSRDGIKGSIRPESRPDCDFGKGFYMGSNPSQVKGLVCGNPHPYFYEIRFDSEQLPSDKKIALDGYDWLCTILAFRSRSHTIQTIPAIATAKTRAEQADVVAGVIADDRMNEAIRRFLNNGLTDAALLQCLKSVDYGFQYVLKSEKACDCIKIVKSRLITGQERQQAAVYSESKRKESTGVVNRMAGLYNRQGHFLQEIIDNPDLLPSGT